MPRVHFVKKARKKNPAAEKGQSYFWWQFRFGGKRYSKTQPKPSQLTQSEFIGGMAEDEEAIAAAVADFQSEHDFEALASACEDTASNVRERGEECEEKKNNMPESLQESPTGELLTERAQACERIAEELEDAATAIRGLIDDADEPEEGKEATAKEQEAQDEKYQQAIDLAEGVDWSVG